MTPDDFRRLALAGLTTDQIALVMEIVQSAELSSRADAEAMIEASREKGRERWRKWDEKRRSNVGKHEQTLDGISKHSRGGDARVEVKTSNLDIEPQEKNKTRGDAAGFVNALRALLDEERLDALVKHRRSRKAPVSAYAAELFIAAAKTCGISIAEATDHCIERNWLTVKPDWLAAKPQARGSPPLRMDDFLGAVIDQQERQHAGPDQKIEGAPQALRAIPGGRWTG